ncbi:LOW QUALITY PROTEIN: retinoblastoma-like protein 2 [Dendronephthya gigantea]|uniref:LOW QUALITY PROTEIN: retinoblastoma-like protein 2 n=1 Tax=Dendronephthya gigantea TaxID=151771 RepID=UPI00106A7979|nr:LOW QUALITY PROTEIN: retinoblastoma-like protein 2 [Dendronephthya gigantea]
MAGANDSNKSEIKQRFDDVCHELNMDEATAVSAWETYERIERNYTLEGDGLHWLACGLYLSGRKMVVPTADESAVVRGNCVSLTRLLRATKLSLIQFFQKMKKWLDMTNSEDFRKKIERLNRNFAVVSVIFKKYDNIFFQIFKPPVPVETTKTHRSRKPRKVPCTVLEIYKFCWTLFVLAKGNFPAISDDLVNSYHLLLSCLDLFYGNAISTRHTKDMVKPEFMEAVLNYTIQKESKVATNVSCIVGYLCDSYDGLPIEAKQIREHHWKPYIEKLFKRKTLKGVERTFAGLLELNNFEANGKSVSNEYEEYVLSSGDFDERVFLSENADDEIGTPRKINQSEIDRRNVEEYLTKTRSLAPQTPLTGRRYLKDKDPNVTPVSTATQSVSRLQSLLARCKPVPSEGLLAIFNECKTNPQQEIENRVNELGEQFSLKYTQPSSVRPDSPSSTKEFADNRWKLAATLYYKALESIARSEKKRLQTQLDLTTLLAQDVFHRSLVACCLEIVIFSYNSQRTFPWILEVYELSPYFFYKVIEVLIRAEDGLSRDVVKHLNYIEEQILETMAWQSDSPLWAAINTLHQVPSCEDVTIPQNIEHVASLRSPIIHPRVERISGEESLKRGVPSSPAVSAHDRFSSPVHPGRACRNLFSGGSGTSAMTAVPASLNTSSSSTNQASAEKQEIPRVPASLPINTADKSTNGNPARSPLPSPVKLTSAPATPDKEAMLRPKKTGSIALFFRKVYHLASVRLRDLCLKLNIKDDLRGKIWTCFEHSLMSSTELMKDRHLDQILMCSIYVMGKVANSEIKFQDIMRHYRTQPQAASHVYRNVLLKAKKTKSGSTSSNESVKVKSEPNSARASPTLNIVSSAPSSRSTSPQMRSASAIPSTPPPSHMTPVGMSQSSPNENDRGDLIEFYNKVYIKRIQKFARKFSSNDNTLDAPPLSPLPVARHQPHSPRRRVTSGQPVYISPRKNGIPLTCNSPRISYSFKESPSENLQNINALLSSCNGNSRKRLLCDNDDDDDYEKSAKQSATNGFMARKLQDMLAERETPAKR